MIQCPLCCTEPLPADHPSTPAIHPYGWCCNSHRHHVLLQMMTIDSDALVPAANSEVTYSSI